MFARGAGFTYFVESQEQLIGSGIDRQCAKSLCEAHLMPLAVPVLGACALGAV